MESMGAISEAEWSSFSEMYTLEEANFMAQLMGNSLQLPSQSFGDSSSNLGFQSSISSVNMVGLNESSYFSSNFGANSLFSAPSTDNYSLGSDYNGSMSMDFYTGNGTSNSSYLIEGDEYFNPEMCEGNKEENPMKTKISNKNLQLKNECSVQIPLTKLEDDNNNINNSSSNNNNQSENSKKRSQVSVDVQKPKRSVRARKSPKTAASTHVNEDSNVGINGQSSSSCCSEDESNGSQEHNGGVSSSTKETLALNLSGKTRASRGAATDPQSLYARKRRERINERLKILQNLVPNGTKVDISTMLEEAVQYVKFLQLQIKLLSSDDLWMYAPLAYNGMDIGLDLKISTPR